MKQLIPTVLWTSKSEVIKQQASAHHFRLSLSEFFPTGTLIQSKLIVHDKNWVTLNSECCQAFSNNIQKVLHILKGQLSFWNSGVCICPDFFQTKRILPLDDCGSGRFPLSLKLKVHKNSCSAVSQSLYIYLSPVLDTFYPKHNTVSWKNKAEKPMATPGLAGHLLSAF